MTFDLFVARFPEFASAPVYLVEAAIAGARAEILERAFGAMYQEALAQLTAHKLALSPYARDLALADPNGGSSYLTEYTRIRKLCSPGVSVLGMSRAP